MYTTMQLVHWWLEEQVRQARRAWGWARTWGGW